MINPVSTSQVITASDPLSRNLYNATPSQLEIINAPATPNTVLSIKAGPGSGKTYTLARRISQLILDGIDPSEILVLSMANRSVNSLSKSLQVQLGDSLQSKPIDICTFHSFCSKILDTYGDKYLPGRRALMNDSQWLFLSRLVSNHNLHLDGIKSKNLTSDKFVKIMKDIRRGGDIEHVAQQYGVSQDFIEAVLRFLEENGIIRYGDLISLACKIINASKKDELIPQLVNYKAIIVDEFQDMYEDLLEVIDVVVNYPSNGDGKHLTVAGDPNQSIYEFLGSNPKLMDSLDVHFGLPVHELHIKESFRCTPEILDLSKTLVPNTSLITQLHSTKPSGHLPVLKKISNPSQEINFIVEEIVRLCYLSGGGINLNDILILSRTNSQIDDISRQLSENYGISTNKLTSSISWNKSKVSIFLSMLAVLDNSYNHQISLLYLLLIIDRSQLRICKIFNISKGKKLEDLVHSKELRVIYKRKQDIIPKFKNLIEAFKTEKQKHLTSPQDVVDSLFNITSSGLMDYLNDDCENLETRKRLMVDLKAFQSSLEISFINYNTDQPSESFISYFLKNYNEDITMDSPTAVNLSTIHTAKGLESKVVFILGTSMFQHGPWDFILKGQLTDDSNNRLFYVALTRGKDLVYITTTLDISDILHDDKFTTLMPKRDVIRSVGVNLAKLQQGEHLYGKFKREYHTTAKIPIHSRFDGFIPTSKIPLKRYGSYDISHNCVKAIIRSLHKLPRF